MKCLECGEEFTPSFVNQLYCSQKCGYRYRYRMKGKIKYPSITFSCAMCGRTVVTEEGSHDRRTRFCCESCEKRFWRHPPYEHVTSITNFRSVAEYASWERRTNE